MRISKVCGGRVYLAGSGEERSFPTEELRWIKVQDFRAILTLQNGEVITVPEADLDRKDFIAGLEDLRKVGHKSKFETP